MNRILTAAVLALTLCSPSEARVSKATIGLMSAWQAAHVDCQDGGPSAKACDSLAPLAAALRAHNVLGCGPWRSEEVHEAARVHIASRPCNGRLVARCARNSRPCH